jgi:hypothetical protein
MWFNTLRFINKQTNKVVSNISESLDIYRVYFQLDGPFLSKLYDLKYNTQSNIYPFVANNDGAIELEKYFGY